MCDGSLGRRKDEIINESLCVMGAWGRRKDEIINESLCVMGAWEGGKMK